MAKRNRKRQQKDGFMIFRPWGSTIVAGTVLALAYVWLGCRCESVGKDIQKLEQERTELNKKYRNEMFRWSQMKSPGSVERALDARKMEMSWPRNGQVVHLPSITLKPELPERGYWAGMAYARLEGTAKHD
jgi:hypothetical protein